MSELSIFIDESGVQEGKTPYYLVTLVLHDQKNDIYDAIATYEEHLRRAGLPNIPFHSTPLIYGTHIYKTLSPEQRKQLLVQFTSFVRHLPIQYVTFTYTSKEFKNTDNLHKRIRRDIVHFIYENYQFLQTFSSLKIFYDNGQKRFLTPCETPAHICSPTTPPFSLKLTTARTTSHK